MTDLPAGREMDARIAEALGLKVGYVEGDSWPYYIPSGKPFRTHAIDRRPIPRYSTDIADAWTLVEWMRERGDLLSLEQGWSHWAWSARFWPGTSKPIMNAAGAAIADTAPLALCRAFLAAVGPEATAGP